MPSTEFVIAPPPQPFLRVKGSDAVFPRSPGLLRRAQLRRAHDRNGRRSRHANRRSSSRRTPTTSLIDGGDFPYPPKRTTFITRSRWWWRWQGGGRDIPLDQALDCVFGYAVGLDMTRRDLQGEARSLAGPGRWARPSRNRRLARRWCRRQISAIPTTAPSGSRSMANCARQGDLNQLIWKVPEMISYLSGLFELVPGDIIMSGTPSGVGAVKKGDRMHGHVEGVGDVRAGVV